MVATPTIVAGELGDEPLPSIVRVLPAQLLERGRVLGRDLVHDLREARQIRVVTRGRPHAEAHANALAQRLGDLAGHRVDTLRTKRGWHAEHDVGRTAADGVPREVEGDRTVLPRPPRRHLGHEREPGRVAPDLVHGGQDRVAPVAEIVEVRGPRSLVRHDRRHVPALRDGRRERDAASLVPAEPDRRTAGRQRSGQVRRALERVEAVRPRHARLAGGFVREERAQDVHGRFEAVEPLRHVRQRDPERDVLADMPSRPEADDEPPAGDVIEQRRLLRQHDRVAERVRQHAMAEPLAGDVVGQRGHRGERLPAPPASLHRGIRDVVVHPDRLEHVVLADPRPGGVQGRPVDLLRGGLDADRDAARHRRSSSACVRPPVVTAPCDADPTSAAYFASTPPV